jgi:hypothetical protein
VRQIKCSWLVRLDEGNILLERLKSVTFSPVRLSRVEGRGSRVRILMEAPFQHLKFVGADHISGPPFLFYLSWVPLMA